jgi:hypothetical protein
MQFHTYLQAQGVQPVSKRTRSEARSDLFYYFEAFHNRRRLHSALDYPSAETHKQLHH